MNKGVVKFLNFLQEELKHIKVNEKYLSLNNWLQDKMANDDKYKKNIELVPVNLPNKEDLERCKIDIQTLLYFMEIDVNSTEAPVLYLDFIFLSFLLKKSDLSVKEHLEVIMYIVEKNLKSDIINTKRQHFVVNRMELKEEFFAKLSTAKFYKFMDSLDLTSVYMLPDRCLTADVVYLKKAIKEHLRKHKDDNIMLLAAHRYIKEHYLDKKDTYNEKDVKFVKVGLKTLGVQTDICKTIEYLLTKNIPKRVVKEEVVVNKEISITKEKKKNLKEENSLYREIKLYYDIEEEKALKPLTLDEIIYVVSLFFKVDISILKIKQYIKDMYRLSFDAENSLGMFNLLYAKMLFYCDNEEIKKAIDAIQSYLGELFVVSEDDYEFYKSAIGEEMKDAYKFLSQNYDYELDMALTLK